VRHRGAHRFVWRLGRTQREREQIRLGLPDLTTYDLLAPQLSGGKDSAVMMAVFMHAARSAGVEDRVISYHSSLGVLEWPAIIFEDTRYPGVSELAALQSAAFGLPPDRHIEVTRTMPGPDGTPMPRSLLTEIAAYGRFPRMGSPYCRKYAKEGVVSSTWTPMVNRLKRELGRPVRDPEDHGTAQRRGSRPEEASALPDRAGQLRARRGRVAAHEGLADRSGQGVARQRAGAVLLVVRLRAWCR
jgi:hypothetical protein